MLNLIKIKKHYSGTPDLSVKILFSLLGPVHSNVLYYDNNIYNIAKSIYNLQKGKLIDLLDNINIEP